MRKLANNYAFIDLQNLYVNVRKLGWRLDYKKFRIYLRDKYAIETAYIFAGYVESNYELYIDLIDAGFVCIFKPTLINTDGTIKGNCDAELVLQAMIDYAKYDKAVIVTGDGDFYCLVKFLLEKEKLEAIIIPNKFKFSSLLKFSEFEPFLFYMNEQEDKLAFKKEKTP